MNAMNRFATGYGKPFVTEEESKPQQACDFVQFNTPGNTCTTPIMIPSVLEFNNEDCVMFNRMNQFIDYYLNIHGIVLIPMKAVMTGYNNCRDFRVEIKSPEGSGLPNFIFAMCNGYISVDNSWR